MFYINYSFLYFTHSVRCLRVPYVEDHCSAPPYVFITWCLISSKGDGVALPLLNEIQGTLYICHSASLG